METSIFSLLWIWVTPKHLSDRESPSLTHVTLLMLMMTTLMMWVWSFSTSYSLLYMEFLTTLSPQRAERERDTRERKYRKRWERETGERERRDWQKRVSTRRQLYKGMLFRCVLTSLSVSFLSFNLHLQMFGSFVSLSLYISLSPSLHGWNSYIYRRKTRKHAVVCP